MKKYTAKYWAQECSRSDSQHREFCADAAESIRAYRGENTYTDVGDCERRMGVWWYLVDTLLPAYYSRTTPEVSTELRKKSGDLFQQIGTVAMERGIQYGLDEFIDFEQLLTDAAMSILLSGRSVLWAQYDATFGQQEYKHKLKRTEAGIFYADGEKYDGDEEELHETKRGITYKETVDVKEDERALLRCLNYNDFRSGPGRNWPEVEWGSQRAWLSREAFETKFNTTDTDGIDFTHFPEDVDQKKKTEDSSYEGKCCLREIWCRESDQVYWVQDKGGKWMEKSEPPIKFKGFYPFDVLSANSTPNTVIPVGDYKHCRDQIIQAEQLFTRKIAIVRAIRTNFGYDATVPELKAILTGDLLGIPVKNWPSYKARGGLANAMEFAAIEPYVAALQVVSAELNEALLRLYEVTKASDIMRGQSDPRETATSVEIRSDWGSLSLKTRQRLYAKHISAGIGKFGEVIFQTFDRERLKSMCDMASIEPELQKLPQPRTGDELITFISEDPQRRYRTEIKSDSLVALDERAENQQRGETIEKIGGFISQSAPLMEQFPSGTPDLVRLIQYVTRSTKMGKEVEPTIMSLTAAITRDLAQKAQQGPQPDPAMAVAQLHAQVEQGKTAAMAQEGMQKMQLEQTKLMLEARQKNTENQIRMMELQIEAQKVNAKIATDQITQALDAERVQIEKFEAELGLAEKYLEEKRLNKQQVIEARNGAGNSKVL